MSSRNIIIPVPEGFEIVKSGSVEQTDMVFSSVSECWLTKHTFYGAPVKNFIAVARKITAEKLF